MFVVFVYPDFRIGGDFNVGGKQQYQVQYRNSTKQQLQVNGIGIMMIG